MAILEFREEPVQDDDERETPCQEPYTGACPYCNQARIITIDRRTLPSHAADRIEAIDRAVGLVCACDGAQAERRRAADVVLREEAQAKDVESFGMIIGEKSEAHGLAKLPQFVHETLEMLFLLVRTDVFDCVTVDLGDSKLTIKNGGNGVDVSRDYKVSIK